MAVEGDEKVIDACRCLQVMMRLSLRWRWMKDASSACPLAPVVTGLGLRVGSKTGQKSIFQRTPQGISVQQTNARR